MSKRISYKNNVKFDGIADLKTHHETTQLSDVFITRISHIGGRYFKQMMDIPSPCRKHELQQAAETCTE